MTEDSADLTTEFTPDRTHVLAGILMAALSFLVVGINPLYFGWILLFPLVFIYWALRTRTVIGERGISTRYAFRGDKEVPWEEVKGIGFKGASTFVETTSGDEHILPGVTFNSLPRLAEASRGRIPDALTAGLESLNDKVTVIDQEGHQVLMTQEEHEEYLKGKNKH